MTTLLVQADALLEGVVASLSAYLEKKRQVFPRFYFLSNAEMLEILSGSNAAGSNELAKLERVQAHLKKCFEGIREVGFEINPNGVPVIVQMASPEGEHVKLVEPVCPRLFHNNVEQWLGALEREMKNSVKSFTAQCIRGRSKAKENAALRKQWRTQYQNQAVLACFQESWTTAIEAALGAAESRSELLKSLEFDQQEQNEIVEAVREPLPPLHRNTMGGLILITL